jgi:hypothetical protein
LHPQGDASLCVGRLIVMKETRCARSRRSAVHYTPKEAASSIWPGYLGWNWSYCGFHFSRRTLRDAISRENKRALDFTKNDTGAQQHASTTTVNT